MNYLKFLFIAIGSILISCSSQKKIVDTHPEKSREGILNEIIPLNQISQSKVDTAQKASQTRFDLSFLDDVENKSYIDSAGNLIINDPILKIKVKKLLRLEPMASIPQSIVDTVTIMSLGNDNNITPENEKIKNIDALSYFKNLKILRIQNNLVRNIRPIEKLDKLIELDLSRNIVSNISAVKKLYNLKVLNLYGNSVSDISYLADLRDLNKLNLWANGVFKIDDLKDLINLTDMNLGRNFIQDISPLRKMNKLKTLWLIGNKIKNPEIISECGSNLMALSVAQCGISDLRFLGNCVQLRELLIFDNEVKDISSLQNLFHLNTFLAANNSISNIDVLAVLVKNKAFSGKGKFTENINIDLSNNKIDYQLPANQKIEKYLMDNVFKVKL